MKQRERFLGWVEIERDTRSILEEGIGVHLVFSLQLPVLTRLTNYLICVLYYMSVVPNFIEYNMWISIHFLR